MSDHEQSSRLPACTDCARRKTKCDRKSPCSSCVVAKSQCRYVRRRSEKKQRVHPASRYEESLTRINHQLETLSHTVRSLVEQNELSSQQRSSNEGSNSTPDSAHAMSGLPYLNKELRVNAIPDYGEAPSSYPRSERSADASSKAISSSEVSRNDVTDSQATAVNIIQALIEDGKAADSLAGEEDSSQTTSSAFSQYPELADLSLPPMASVLQLLALTKSAPQWYFVEFPHTDVEGFAQLCQSLYFPTQPFTIYAWINVNCGLLYLYQDLDRSRYTELHLTKSQVSQAVSMCGKNIDRAVSCLRISVNPSFEAVCALICAAVVNMDSARGFSSWKLVSAAARMSMDLGYHRLPSGHGDRQRSQKRKLFWYVYSTDRSLAFNFGRSPTIQDYDISTERPLSSEDFKSRWGFTFRDYINFAQLLHNIYEQLFCARAQQEPLPVRVQRVHHFAAEVSQIRDELEKTLDRQDPLFQSNLIGFSAILALIYRVLPPDNAVDTHVNNRADHSPLLFHSLCVEAGRATLSRLVEYWHTTSNQLDEGNARISINWSLLFMPFMPYIAVFGNQVLTGNEEDLVLLRDVVKVVETAAEASSATNKMYQAFLRLLRMAELWSASGHGEQGQAQSLPTQSSPGLDRGTFASSKQANGMAADVVMTAPAVMEFSLDDWQDSEMLYQDWDMVFNEFDLGLGAENARDMMPWFEQQMMGPTTPSE